MVCLLAGGLSTTGSGYPSSPSYTAEWLCVAYTSTAGLLVLSVLCIAVGGVLAVMGLFVGVVFMVVYLVELHGIITTCPSRGLILLAHW